MINCFSLASISVHNFSSRAIDAREIFRRTLIKSATCSHFRSFFKDIFGAISCFIIQSKMSLNFHSEFSTCRPSERAREKE